MKLDGVSPNLITNSEVREMLRQRGNDDLAQRNTRYCYVRGLLEIGGQIRYIASENGGAELVTISHVNDEIKRASSSIFFKVIEKRIYIVAGSVNEKLFGEEFKFYNEERKPSVTLAIPEEFDINDFMESYVEFYNNRYLSNESLEENRNDRNSNRNINIKRYKVYKEEV